MITEAQNQLLTRVEGDAPMGALLREYWVPAIRSDRIEAGGAPVRVRLFGGDYVAYRGQDGKVGVLDERCPHRGASLLLARNEDNCLRCIFHGWKFDADGKCVDMPNERSERGGFKDNIRIEHYPVVEAGHVAWAYFGTRAEPPPFPAFLFNTLPAEHSLAYVGPLECNWLQAIEPALDNSHATVLHMDTTKMLLTGHLASAKLDLAPLYDVDVQPYGIRAAASRRRPDGKKYVRVIEYVVPFYAFVPSEPGQDQLMLAITPVDDTHAMQWFFIFNEKLPISHDGPRREGFDARWWAFGPGYASVDPNNFRKGRDAANDWGQDRDQMAKGSFAGLYPLCFEDLAVQESQGVIADRTRERLGAADAAVARLRRFLLTAVTDHQQGKPPLGLDIEMPYAEILGSSYILEADDDWRRFFVPGASRQPAQQPAIGAAE